MPISDGYFEDLDYQKTLSFKRQIEIESSDTLSFDDFLVDYFSSDT
jgi:glutamate--cysteine ligase